MLNFNQLKRNRNLVNDIDWSMTPDKAVDMYLEWGSGWTRGHEFVSYQNQESVYFVVYDWETPPQVTLVKRTHEGAEDIAKMTVPKDLFDHAVKEDGYRPGIGVHPLSKPLKDWVCKAIDSTYFS
ncbi:MAG: hypothetical protein GY702_24800 [Desulfobulbaceae bacterium]|nr:hypothetical protein [Desulfobulbaceae bacterium]